MTAAEYRQAPNRVQFCPIPAAFKLGNEAEAAARRSDLSGDPVFWAIRRRAVRDNAAAPPQYRPVAVTPEIRICRIVAIATFPAPSLACMRSNARRSTGCAA
jgi:hypothetical protein